MAKSFLAALSVILPIALMLLCGAGARKATYIDKQFISSANKLIFHLFLPLSLFESCYTSPLGNTESVKMIIFCCAGILLMFLIYIPISKNTDSMDSRRSVILQASFRGNLAIFGFPVLSLMYDSSQLGVMAILMAFMIPELNLLAVISFEFFSGKKANLKHAIIRIVKNPLIIAILFGVIFNLLSVPIPSPIMKAISSMASVTTPLAFLALGADFSFTSARENWKAISVALIGKLVLLPLLALLVGVALGLRGPMLVSAVTLFGAPVAVSSAPMAAEMGGDRELANQAVVVSTLIGVFTMFVWIFAMSFFGLL